MPHRRVAAEELATLLGVLSHPARLRIIEELRGGERDVATLQALLGIPHSGVSQHLANLRGHRLVIERREGRRIYYRLRSRKLADWLLAGLAVIQDEAEHASELAATIERARRAWGRR